MLCVRCKTSVRQFELGSTALIAASAAKTRVRLASAITALNVLVASGFSIAGLFKPELVFPAGSVQTEASLIFAMYAAARTLPLALVALAAIYQRSRSGLKVLGLLAGLIQFSDAAVGLYQHDIGKIIGPLVLGALQMYAIWTLRADL
jgi:hypothetical protein